MERLAGHTPGFGLLPGDSDEYITSHGAAVHSTKDTVIAVRWRGRERHMFFQDGPFFRLRSRAGARVLGTFASASRA